DLQSCTLLRSSVFPAASSANRDLLPFPTRRSSDLSHLPALQASSEVELTAVCTTRPESAEAARQAWGARLAFDDWRKMIASPEIDRKSTRLNSSHLGISYAVFCLKKNSGRLHSRVD